MTNLTGHALSKIDRSDSRYQALLALHSRLERKDVTIWGADAEAEATARLNWIRCTLCQTPG